MTIPISTLVWLAVTIAAFVVGYHLGRRGAGMPAGRAPEHAPGHDGTGLPPPPAAGRPSIPPVTGNSAPARPRAAPPPAAAGPRPGYDGPASSSTPVRRTSAPPPAAAGGTAATRREPAGKAKEPDPEPDPAPSRAPSETRPPASTRRRPDGAAAMAGVRSWGYQLQNIDIARAAASPFDLLVIDYSKDGSAAGALSPGEVETLKRRADGARRLVIAYLSIGEAESYRYYWQASWKRDKPAWLLGENPDWDENFTVCYWDPGWQRIICGSAESYLDRIIAAGFDGVYLDKADAVYDIETRLGKVARTRPDLEGDMVAFIARISAYAKSKRPGFLIVMQNAEELLEHEATVGAIDAVAKEELVYGASTPGRRNSRTEIEDARRSLDIARRAGKPVLVVEYLDEPAKVRDAADITTGFGYVLYVAPKDRALDRLNFEVLEA